MKAMHHVLTYLYQKEERSKGPKFLFKSYDVVYSRNFAHQIDVTNGII